MWVSCYYYYANLSQKAVQSFVIHWPALQSTFVPGTELLICCSIVLKPNGTLQYEITHVVYSTSNVSKKKEI